MFAHVVSNSEMKFIIFNLELAMRDWKKTEWPSGLRRCD